MLLLVCQIHRHHICDYSGMTSGVEELFKEKEVRAGPAQDGTVPRGVRRGVRVASNLHRQRRAQQSRNVSLQKHREDRPARLKVPPGALLKDLK